MSFEGRKVRLAAQRGVLAVVAALWVGTASAAPVVLDLTGQADALFGGVGQIGNYGDYGLYLGRDFDDPNDDTGPANNGNARFFNWRWNSVEMTIFDDGSANISGAITRLLDEVNGDAPPNGDNRVWNMNIDLDGLVLTGNNWQGSNTGYYDGILDDLQAGGETGVGLEWESVDLSISPDPDYVPTGTSVPEDNWIEFEMPWIGHDRGAELHLDNLNGGTGLTFEAWYKHQPLNESYWYKVGDTKAVATVRPGTPPPPGVPEPGTIALLGTGLLGLAWVRRRRSQDEAAV